MVEMYFENFVFNNILQPFQLNTTNQVVVLSIMILTHEETDVKGIGIYGAELSIAGFSGYVTEVLVLKYGDFKNVIKNIATMKK